MGALASKPANPEAIEASAAAASMAGSAKETFIDPSQVAVDEESAPLQPPLVAEDDACTKAKKQQWKQYRKVACLTFVCLTIALMSIGIILAGVLPDKNTAAVWTLPPTTRVYYISADEVSWTYTPGGKDTVHGPLYGTYINTSADPAYVDGTFIKAQFVQYTDSSFTTKSPGREAGGRWEHMGIIGPVLHAAAGDTLQITLRNMLGSGVAINLEPMGAHWNVQGLLNPIGSGMIATFIIEVPLEAGPPTDSSESSSLYLYHSSLNPTRHENSGLFGPIVVSRPGEVNSDGTPKGTDREFITIFQSFNEVETEFITFNAANISKNGWSTDRYAINGHSFGTLKGLNCKVGERVRWYIGGLGTENGMHNFHWHGNVLQRNGHYLDQITAIPASTSTADLLPDNPGEWLFHCHVNSHLTNGMVTTYTVEGDTPAPTVGGTVRWYYIAADEVEWDYAPLGAVACATNGSLLPFDQHSEAATYLGTPEGVRIGSKYTKAIFREYTDDTFTTLKNRSAEDAYLGLLGPVIRGQVGDTLKIVLRNQLIQQHAVTLHPHGVLYNKSSEGAPYVDGTSDAEKEDDAVMPGVTYTYTWEVPARAGPGFNDPSSVMWMYHSHADEALDTWAGLAGPIIITGRDAAVKEDGSPADVDSEKILFFAAMDEAQSLYTEYNVVKYLGADQNMTALLEDPDFIDASLHRSINGYMYCNMPRMSFVAGSKIRFHFMSLGDIGDMHTPKMGMGGGFLNLGVRQDSIEMSAGAMHSVDVVLTEQGTWQLGCNVLEHEAGGIVSLYEVTPASLFEQVSGTVRSFYLAAEEVEWDYAPHGYIKCTGMNYSARAALGGYLQRSNVSIGSGMYRKALFKQYSDATFSTRVPLSHDYMGLLGPLMVMEPGDTLRVTLKNSASFPVNFSPGGGLVATGDSSLGREVQPGEIFQYEWIVPSEAAPSPHDLSSVGYGYASTVDRWTQALLGLEGIMVVVRKGELGPNLLPRDVDQMIPLLWQVFNENLSPYLQENMQNAGLNVSAIDVNDDAFVETNIKHTLNGFMYCNLPTPQIALNSRTRWVFMSVGATEGLHAPVFTKFPLFDADGSHPSAMLMPGYTSSMDMFADVPGTYPFWCNVHDHVEAGMMAQFHVASSR